MTASAHSTAQRATRGTILLAGRSGLVQLAQVASSLIIARVVVPDAYGAFAVAVTGVGFARYIGDLGVSNSLLALPKVTSGLMRSGALISLVCGVVATLVLFGLAAPLAAILNGPDYTQLLIRVLALTVLFDSMRFGPIVRLNRELRFGAIGIASLIETMLMYACQIGLLLAGAGVWALVIAQLVRSLSGLAIMTKQAGWVMPARREPLLAMIRRGIPYQAPGALGAGAGFLFPVILAGSLSADGVGYWAWATVLSTPITALVLVISSVTLPSLVRLRESAPASIPRATTLMLRASILVPAAASGVLIGFSAVLIQYLFGERWAPALGAVNMNLIGVIPATFSFFLAAALESEQRAGIRFWVGVAAVLVGLPALIVLSDAWGVTGAGFATAVLMPLVDAVGLALFAKVALGRAVVGALLAFGLCLGCSVAVQGLVVSVPTLVVLLAGCSVPAILIVWFSDREAVRAVLRFGVPLPARVRSLLGIRELPDGMSG